MKYLFYFIVFVFCLCSLSSCKSEYEQLVKSELAKKERNEDLFLGLQMGQTRKEFFDHCWQLNKEKKIAQGSGNQYAKYYLKPEPGQDSTKTVEILFYGMFDEEKVMYGMDMKMSFTSWSLWNEDYHSDVLMKFMEEKYMKDEKGNPFMSIKVSEEVHALVKVDLNKQIRMVPLDKQTIIVKIEDLQKELYHLPKS